MQEKLNRRNRNRKISQDNSSKPEGQSMATAQPASGPTDQMSNSQAQSVDEAIDVLSFMGFKL